MKTTFTSPTQHGSTNMVFVCFSSSFYLIGQLLSTAHHGNSELIYITKSWKLLPKTLDQWQLWSPQAKQEELKWTGVLFESQVISFWVWSSFIKQISIINIDINKVLGGERAGILAYPVRLPTMLSSHMDTGLCSGCLISKPVPCQWFGKGIWRGLSFWAIITQWKIQEKLLVPGFHWPITSLCGHLRSKPKESKQKGRWKIALSMALPL